MGITRPVPIVYTDSSRHYPSLDGLRGYAILLVLLYHLFNVGPGWMGVDLFFVLSGFLITSILLDSRNDEHYFYNFYVKRALRIFPLYFAVLILYFVIHFSINGWGRVLDTIPYFFYLQNVVFSFERALPFKYFEALKHFWSLSVEEHYYILFPLLVRFTPLNYMKQMLLAMVGIALASRLFFYWNDVVLAAYVFTPSRIDSLAIGGLTAMYARSKKTVSIWYLVVVGLCMFIHVLVSRDLYQPMYRLWGYTVVDVFFSAVLLVSLNGSTWVKHLFQHPLVRHLGKYSYGLYVFHYIYVTELGQDRVVLVLALTYVSALVSYHILEKPFLNLKKKWVR